MGASCLDTDTTAGPLRPSWPSSCASWIYNYVCNQCLSPLTLWVRISRMRHLLDKRLCDKVYKWLTAGRWFPFGTPVSSTNKTDRHDIIEILLKVALNTITLIITLVAKATPAFRFVPRVFVLKIQKDWRHLNINVLSLIN